MWGAIIGDLAGSIYEFSQIKKITNILIDDLIVENSFYSDDTILTISILDALLNGGDYEFFLKRYAYLYQDYKPSFEPYFKTTFSPRFLKWVNGSFIGTSTGNGAMMRISPIGYLCDTEEGVRRNAYLATIPSHNSKEAIDAATLVALIIYFSRRHYSKEEIIERLSLQFEYIPFQKFNSTCSETIDNCLFALFNSNSFEDSLRRIISYGGDTDTNACIVGSMAEAMYGIDQELINTCRNKIPREFNEIIDLGYSKVIKF